MCVLRIKLTLRFHPSTPGTIVDLYRADTSFMLVYTLFASLVLEKFDSEFHAGGCVILSVIRYITSNWFFFFFFLHFYFPASGQAVVTGVVPFSPRFLPSIFIAHRVQQSHCSSIFHRVLLLTHALALSASQFVHKKKPQRIYTNMHSAGLELTKLAYTRLEDNLIRHRGDRSTMNGVNEARPQYLQ